MTNWRRMLVPGAFAVGGLLFIFAAAKPAIADGQSVDVTLLVIGIVDLFFGVVLWRKAKRSEPV